MLRWLLVLMLSLPLVVEAAEPDESSLVDQIDYDLPSHSVDDDTGALLGRDECDQLQARSSNTRFTFELNVDPTETEGSVSRLADVWLYELAPDDAAIDCDASSCVPLDDEVSSDSTSVEVAVDPQTLLQGSGCEQDRDVFVRIELVEDFADANALTSADARVRLDVTGPTRPPAIEDAFATDKILELQVTLADNTSEDAKRWYVGWGPADSMAESADELTPIGSFGAAVTKTTLDSLELPVDLAIHLYVWGRDEAGNDGALSDPYLAQPVMATDYWESYGRDGATCSSGVGTSGWLPLALLLLFWLYRRRRGVVAPFVFALGMLVAANASADDGVVEVRLGTFTPVVTSDPLFTQFFGSHLRWMVSLDGGWLFANLRAVELGLDAGLGFTSFGGNVRTADGQVIDEASSLTLVPMRLGLRAVSGAWSRWLVIGARGGLTAHYWRFGNSLGVSVAEDGSIGRGVNWGWYSAVQLGLDLTGADRESAQKLENTWALSKTTLFVEGAYSDVDSFGSSGMNFGDLQLNAGLGFSF